jgi:hypothetical protein
MRPKERLEVINTSKPKTFREHGIELSGLKIGAEFIDPLNYYQLLTNDALAGRPSFVTW